MPFAWHCGHFFFYDGYEEEIGNYSSFGYLICCFLYILCGTGQNDVGIDSVKAEEYTAVLENSINLDSIARAYFGVLPTNVETNSR